MVALTGQIPMKFVGSDAFQEVDCINITLSVTKHNQLITDASEIAPAVREAFEIANSGRKGPVLLDFPKDILLTEVNYRPTSKKRIMLGYQPTTKAHIGQIKRCSKKLSKAKKPLVLIGGGSQPFYYARNSLADSFSKTQTAIGDLALIGIIGLHTPTS